ncbi:MAG: Na/Pi symporter [Synergistaceae bacterium]|nr:Na/Pi symporter [Synergistaceae bacterium]
MFWGFIAILGGLALFLFGIDACCRSFQHIGGWLHSALFRLAKGRVKPFVFGTLLTLITQNSTVATSLAIGFVDIGAMNLTEAILAMSGASFGGGIVILLISLDVVRFAPLLLFVSLILIRLSKKPVVQSYGRVLQGISLVLIGMLMIQNGVVPLLQSPTTKSLILWGSRNFFLAGLIAFALTSIIQNNTVVIAIAISVASAGLMTISSGMAIVLGAHVGSTTIIMLSGLAGRLNSRRLGFATVLYKLLGAFLVLLLTPLIIALVRKLGLYGFPLTAASSLATFQIILATLNALLVTPFSDLIRRCCERVFPSLGDPGEPAFLNRELLDAPAVALTLLSRETTRLANFVEAFLQILFTVPSERWRLTRLRANLKDLSRECQSFLSSLALPRNEAALMRRYINLSVALSSLSDIIICIDRELVPVDTSHFSGTAVRNLIDQVLTVLRLALRFFVLGDEAMERSARAEIAKFRRAENQLRYSLAYDEMSEEGSGELWPLLTVFVRIVHASERMLESVKLAPPAMREGKVTG